MRLHACPEVDFEDEDKSEEDEGLWEVAKRIDAAEKRVSAVGVVERPPTTP